MAPCLVLDPNGITEEGRTTLLDPTGERVTCDIKPLGEQHEVFAHMEIKGWIPSSDRNDFRTFLYDPMTSDKIELPPFAHHLPRVFQCALSDKPTNIGCIVVILHPNERCFWYCRIGGPNEWNKYDYDVGSQQYDTKGLVWEKIVIRNLTSCKGKFYFPISGVKHGIIEFNPSPVTRIVTMRGMPRGYNADACFFELDEEPYQFFAFKGASSITGITLYKDRLGKATRFALEPNCVYWIRPHDNSMHIFDIVENTQRVCYHPSEDLPSYPQKHFGCFLAIS
uniref:KIB1-4 beta-propeller domain-containing protein n=1 Tax=Setaria viridis TaxID=4556 RepID=A0A4U6TLW0_SETVI|nr:hypothetical protein SEVIR_9G558100v2 [Setaria viridis]